MKLGERNSKKRILIGAICSLIVFTSVPTVGFSIENKAVDQKPALIKPFSTRQIKRKQNLPI